MEDSNQQDNNEMNNDNISDYDSDDEDEEYKYAIPLLYDNNILQRLKQNDPSITHLNIPLDCIGNFTQNDECNFNNIDWKVDGDCIINNTQLKHMKIYYRGICLGRSVDQPYVLGEIGHKLPTRNQLQDFFSCIYRNRSINIICFNSICVCDEFGGGLIKGLSGHHSLVRLDIGQDYYTGIDGQWGSIGCRAIGKVINHPLTKLKDLRLSYSKLDDQAIQTLSDAIMGINILQKLCLNGNKDVTSVGWRALSTVLQHPNCKLIKISLNHNANIKNKSVHEGVNILGSALRGSSVKALDLSSNKSIITNKWQTLFDQLYHSSVESLELSDNKIDDAGLASVANIHTLKSLVLGINRLITPTGWQSFFNSLQRRGTRLVKLDITYNKIGSTCVAALGSLLNSMNTLKTLVMNGMIYLNDAENSSEHMTPQGWVRLFTTLQDSDLNLVKLYLGENQIDDEGMQLLIPLVSNMNSLKHLGLSCNYSLTPTGWQALITGYLQSPNFALEKLYLGSNNINDDTVVALTSALIHNETLKELDLEGCEYDSDNDEQEVEESITEIGWEALSTLLCNKTSILDTYNSNHTLEYVGEIHPTDYLVSYLALNINEDKVEVARQKILQTHFSSEDDKKIQELLDMELEMMSTAIAWIGRPTHASWIGTNVSGLSLMFNLMRRVPDLFDSSPQKKPTGKREPGA